MVMIIVIMRNNHKVILVYCSDLKNIKFSLSNNSIKASFLENKISLGL